MDKPVRVDLDALLKREFVSYRNGLSLEVTKAEIVGSADKDEIHVHWVLRYSGKRWPLVVLRPSLEDYTHWQTQVGIYSKGTAGKGFCVLFKSNGDPRGFGPPVYIEDEFLEIDEKKGKAEGAIRVDLHRARELLAESDPTGFGKDAKPEFYIQLEHLPHTRGESLDLDAWNGELRTKLIKVAAKGR